MTLCHLVLFQCHHGMRSMQVAKWLQSQVISASITPAKGCCYSSFDMQTILHCNPHGPSFCRVSKKFTTLLVGSMPMRLKPTPLSQLTRGSWSKWWTCPRRFFISKQRKKTRHHSRILAIVLTCDQCQNPELIFFSLALCLRSLEPLWTKCIRKFFCFNKKRDTWEIACWMNHGIGKFLVGHSEL